MYNSNLWLDYQDYSVNSQLHPGYPSASQAPSNDVLVEAEHDGHISNKPQRSPDYKETGKGANSEYDIQVEETSEEYKDWEIQWNPPSRTVKFSDLDTVAEE